MPLCHIIVPRDSPQECWADKVCIDANLAERHSGALLSRLSRQFDHTNTIPRLLRLDLELAFTLYGRNEILVEADVVTSGARVLADIPSTSLVLCLVVVDFLLGNQQTVRFLWLDAELGVSGVRQSAGVLGFLHVLAVLDEAAVVAADEVFERLLHGADDGGLDCDEEILLLVLQDDGECVVGLALDASQRAVEACYAARTAEEAERLVYCV